AGVANTQAKFALAAAQQKAAAANGPKPLPGRSVLGQINPLKAHALIEEMKKSSGAQAGITAGLEEAVNTVTGKGDMPETDWQRNGDLLMGEAAQFAKGGVGSEAEIKDLKESFRKARTSAQRQNFLKNMDKYFQHGIETMNETLTQQKYINLPNPWAKKGAD